MSLTFKAVEGGHYIVSDHHGLDLYNLFYYADCRYYNGWTFCSIIDGDEVSISDLKEIINFTDSIK